MLSSKIIVIVLTYLLFQIQFHKGYSKTVRLSNEAESWSKAPTTLGKINRPGHWGRIDNFVEFTEDGDQLAVENVSYSNSSGEVKKSLGKRRKILKGKKTNGQNNKTSIVKNEGRGCPVTFPCPNLQKAIYPVIPVIIASLIGLIGSIIISGIVRLVHKKKNDDETDQDLYSGYGATGYDHRSQANPTLSGIMKNVFPTLIESVYSALENIY